MSRENITKPSREGYVKLAISHTRFNRRTEIVALKDSIRRVTAKDVYSLNTLPNKPTSAMDGIAVRYDDLYCENLDTSRWELGEDYIFSNTGVAVPPEYDTVIPIEAVEFDKGDRIHIRKLPSYKGEKVNPCGSMMKKGDLLLPKNYLITASQLGVLASGGIQELEVIAKPKVAIIPTGDELIPAGIPLYLGKNIETNSIVMEALIKEWGGEPVVYPIIPDDPEQIYNVLCQAIAQTDIIILNAGTSKGNKDHAISILEKVGNILVYEVAHGPARPTNFTVAEGKPILGLVGPPIGAELTANWYVRPLIDRYLNQPSLQPQTLKVKLLDSFNSPVPFDFYTQILITKKAESYVGTKVKGRVDVSVKANAILHIPSGTSYKVGNEVTVELKVPIEYINRE